jgi:cardiolipin synthase
MTLMSRDDEDDASPSRTVRLRRVLEGIVGVPATEGNAIDVLTNGDEIFPAMLDAIDGAQHTVDFLTFVYWAGDIGREFAHHLAGRARAGVRVRALLDSYGAKSMERTLVAEMEDAGVQVRWFRPLRRFHLGEFNHRTHRKVMIVDEEVAFTGGVGIADVWRGDARNECEWRDTHFRIRGPAVDGLRAAFLDNWAETDPHLFQEAVDRFPEQPQPGAAVAQCVRGAAETGWSDVATLFRALLQLAEQRVRIATAYFVPDDELMERFTDAAARGVVIDVLLPGPHADKRFVQLASEAAYSQLLDAGVRIWTFQPSMLHTKVMTIDGVIANIGSANLNARSTQLDEEINVVVLDHELVRVLDEQFDADLERSVEIERGRWERRPITQRWLEALTNPLRRVF